MIDNGAGSQREREREIWNICMGYAISLGNIYIYISDCGSQHYISLSLSLSLSLCVCVCVCVYVCVVPYVRGKQRGMVSL